MLNIEKTIKYFFYGLIFILPLFFLPVFKNSVGIDNYHKSLLLFLLVPLIFFVYIFKKVRIDKFKLSILDLLVLAFLFFSIISTIFSIDIFSSVWGAYVYFGIPLITIFSIVIFYFLILNIVKKEDIDKIVKILISSFGLIIVFFVFILYNIGGSFVKFFELSQGSFEDISILIVVFDILLIFILLSGKVNEMFHKYPQIFLVKVLLFVSFLFLMFINFLPAWWSFLVGLTLILVFDIRGLLGSKEEVTKKKRSKLALFFNTRNLVVILLLISLAFILFNNSSDTVTTTAERVVPRMQLDIANSLGLVNEMRGKEFMIGAGLENFKYIFSELRDPVMNNTPFWHIRFNKSSSHIINILITTGVIGLFIYLSMFIYLFIHIFRSFPVQGSKKEDDFRFLMTFIPFVVLFFAQFIYSLNINLLFLFWLFFALTVIHLKIKIIELKIPFISLLSSSGMLGKSKNESKDLFVKVLLWILFVLWFLSLGYAFKYYLADAYARTGSENNINKAIILNPHRYNYHADLAKDYLFTALDKLKKGGEENLETAGKYFQKSILSGGRAVELASDYVVPYETLAIIYRQIGYYSPTYKNLAVDMFQKAGELEPSNPVIFLELGKLLIENDPQEAMKALERADELKKGYPQIRLNLAKAYINVEKEKEALTILEDLLIENTNVDIYYEMGRAAYNLEEYQKAIDNFNQVIAMSPIHANALYSLGLSHEQLGQKGEALYFFKKVFQLNPEDKVLDVKIKSLETSFKD